jgi:hypothetical protein
VGQSEEPGLDFIPGVAVFGIDVITVGPGEYSLADVQLHGIASFEGTIP